MSPRLSLSLSAALLVAVITLCIGVSPVAAQTEKVLFSFGSNNSPSGSSPNGRLIFDAAGNLYGTTFYGGTGSSIYCSDGGTYGCGTAFELTPQQDGSWSETVIHNFGNVGDGANPSAGMVADAAGNLYGTTTAGGATSTGGCGTVFELLKPQTGGIWIEKILYTFCSQSYADGDWPNGELIFDGKGNLYGTTLEGGARPSCSCGTVFELSPSSSGVWKEKVLQTFGFGPGGEAPTGGLIFDRSGNLYGVAATGGSKCYFGWGCGVVFELIPAQQGSWTEKVLYTFVGSIQDQIGQPDTTLIFDSSGNLYGTSAYSGPFELSRGPGNSWTTKKLYAACCFPNGLTFGTDGDLFGTNGADLGGSCCGQAFKLTLQSDGNWIETDLHKFGGSKSDGRYPSSPLTFDSAGNMYGTTSQGGASLDGYAGVIFQITP